ncbi:MAG: hypothetical protein OEV31_03720 [Gammaproteobacteria bacterium]|nr:hypothetical protein [Gammaproteobacteria bacterium]
MNGCAMAGNQIAPATLQKPISLAAGDLEKGGMAFITPSTVTGQELIAAMP